jgi:predicted dehydrogenase
MIGIGVIGYGYWGPNLVRNFMEASGSRVVAVCDSRPQRLAELQNRYPSVKGTGNYRDLLEDSSIDAIAIATPVSSHFELALQALKAGKHVLVEKPLTSSSEQAVQLIEEAARRQRVLMVDHTFVYTGAVRKIQKMIAANELGEIYYYDSVRVNLGLFQHDVNVMWDLAVHDLAILDYVFPSRPVAVSATGISHLSGQPENVAYITLFFAEQQIAHLHVNWLAPVKVRQTLIGGSERMIVYDDIEPSEKIKIYDKGVSLSQRPEALYELLVSYRSGDMWAPKLDVTEALRTEAAHFIDCIENHKQPETDGHTGLRIIRLLEAAEASLRARGQLVELA